MPIYEFHYQNQLVLHHWNFLFYQFYTEVNTYINEINNFIYKKIIITDL